MGSSFDSSVRKALVALAIEETLLEKSVQDYEKVSEQLNANYSCYIPDCYNHPDYLKEILQKLYGHLAEEIINKISFRLQEFSYQKQIAEFLEKLSGKQIQISSDTNVEKSVIRLAVERALLEMGKPELEKVESRLKNDFNCRLEDCLENPEYLKKILFGLYGNRYDSIFTSIQRILNTIKVDGEIEKFLVVMK